MNCVINPAFSKYSDFIKSVPSIFSNEGETIYKGRNEVKILDHDGQRFNVKSFKVPNVINTIAYRYFRKSKARRSFEYAGMMLGKGVNTPAPVAYIEYFNCLGLKKSYYISVQEDYDFTFRQLPSMPIDEIREILIQFTRFTYNFHLAGIYFIDHSPGNTLIKKTDEGYKFSLVDLNRTKFYNYPIDVESGIKNFYRLASTPDMVRVMAKEYAALRGLNADIVIDKMMSLTMAHNEKVRLKKLRAGK